MSDAQSPLTREPWLGDALRAIAELSPRDDAALHALLHALSLPIVGIDAQLAPQPSTPSTRRAETDDTPTPDGAAPPAAQPLVAASGETGSRSWRMPTRMNTHTEAPSSPPPGFDSIAPMAWDAGAPSPPPPLIARRRRRAIVAALLHERVAEGPPDMRRIVRQLVRGRPITRVPRLPRRTLRHGVELRIDRAPWLQIFHHDQMELRDAIVALVGAERVRTVWLNGGPVPPPRRRRSSVAAPATDPPPLMPALVLGDAGAGWRGDGDAPAPAAAWHAWAESLQRQGRRAMLLTPFDPPRIRGLAALPWSERTTLSAALRARAGEHVAGAPGPSGADLDALARDVSPAVIVGPALLRHARRERALAPSAEALLAAGDAVQAQGAGWLTFDAGAQRELRLELKDSPDLEPALLRVEALRAGSSDGSAVEEQLVALELRGLLVDESAAASLAPALKSLAVAAAAPADDAAVQRADAVATWAAHAWRRMSPAAQATIAARQLAFAASQRLAAGGASGVWLHGDGSGAPEVPPAAPWLGSGAAGQPAVIELRRYDDGSVELVVEPASDATSARHAAYLAQGDWLGVEHAGAQQLLPYIGAPLRVPLHADDHPFDATRPVVLRRGDGSVHTLRVATAPDMLAQSLVQTKSGLVALVVEPRLAVGVTRDSYVLGASIVLAWPAQNRSQYARVVDIGEAGRNHLVALELESNAYATAPFDTGLGPAGHGDAPLMYVYDAERRSYVEQPTSGAQLESAAPVLVWHPQDGWNWVIVQKEGSFVQPPLTTFETIKSFARQAAVQRWRAYLVGTAQAERAARSLRDMLSSMLGDDRAMYADGRGDSSGNVARAAFDDMRADIVSAPSSVIVLLGHDELGAQAHEALQLAAKANRPVVWLPLTDDPGPAQEALARWPAELAGVLQRQWYGTDIDRLAAQLQRFWPDGRSTPEAVPAAGSPPDQAQAKAVKPPAPPPAAQQSLQARFVAMVEGAEESSLGLFAVDVLPAFALRRVEDSALRERNPSRPLLLFVHGIGGTAEATFGALLRDDAVLRDRLLSAYEGELYVWQYRGYSRGPLANAVELLRALPPHTGLHLVTYSAGGVIGELLVRAAAGFDASDEALLAEQTRIEPDAPSHLRELAELSSAKSLQIDRFVRIAAPIAGSTIYAAQPGRVALRLRPLLPWLGTVLAAMPGVESFLTNPKLLPGPTSLIPGAGVQALLTTRRVVDAPLTVITGMRDGSGASGSWLSRLWGAGEDDSNAPPGDNWTTLASACAGVERERGVDLLVIAGPDIQHARYMNDARVRQAIVDALLSDGTPPGFEHVSSVAELQHRYGDPALAEQNAEPKRAA